MKQQFRILYREFLFRMVDVELLSSHAQGDMSKLFGQFAALLLFISLLFSIPALGVTGTNFPPLEQLLAAISAEHFLLATTMLVAGLFAVLSWDSTFPDRRDVLILSPLPVRTRTLFLARVAAMTTALGLAVALLNIPAGFAWPLGLNYRSEARTVPAFTYDPAVDPVDAASLEPMLRRELAGAHRPGGPLAQGTGAGLAIGVVKHGERRVYTFGTAKPDSIFEIGSISKTFTGLLLSQMAEEDKVRLDEPVRELMPQGTVAKPRGNEITLLDLATQHSGLPRMPGNMNTVDSGNPYADYHAADLYDDVAKRGVGRTGDARFLYSNFGFGLLGQALAARSGSSWTDLIQRTITRPLHMNDTAVSLSPDQQSRFIQGHDGNHRPVHAWDVADGLAGAGALRSTADDMLTYLDANLHPDQRAPLSSALRKSHQLQADVGPRTRIALAWLYNADNATYYHSGGTGGFSSYSCFNPRGDYAVIVLLNSSPELPFADLLGEHIRQRLSGEPALSLDLVSIPPSGGVWHFLRLLAAYWITMLAAGTFVFCCVLGIQGLVALLLPRRLFLRVSSFLQLAAFSAFVSVYFVQPMLTTPETLLKAQSGSALSWAPSYWFLGLFQQLSGSSALAPLAGRAWTALAIAVCVTAAAYMLSYFRTLRRIVEEPDIVPLSRNSWLSRLAHGFGGAVVLFSIRTLMRSRRHRVILAFYLGVGLAITIYLLKGSTEALQSSVSSAPDVWQYLSTPLLAASFVIMGCWIVGTRAVFSLPLDLRANWIFRVLPLGGGPACLKARRRALFALSVAPVFAISALVFFSLTPWRTAVNHLIVLGLFATILAELCLMGDQKIPFTCSYLPGKSKLHIAFWLWVGLIVFVIKKAAEFERQALEHPAHYAMLVGVLVLLALLARWRNAATTLDEDVAQFEAEENDSLLVLGLHDADFTNASARK
jgi:CubicO group peptidase (beta-lactamase class C family)